MNPGLPGLGIGGLFYILSALAMPVVALVRAARGAPAAAVRRELAARQCAIALGIIGCMTLAFWGLDVALELHPVDGGAGTELQRRWHSVRISALAVTAAVLASVLFAMHAVRLLVRRRRLPRLATLARELR